jgi:hypothetical protein
MSFQDVGDPLLDFIIKGYSTFSVHFPFLFWPLFLSPFGMGIAVPRFVFSDFRNVDKSIP